MSRELCEQMDVTAHLLGQLLERFAKAVRNGQWDAATAALHAIEQECSASLPNARALRDLQHTFHLRKTA